MLVLINLPQPSTILLVLLVRRPMLLRTMRRPPAVRTLMRHRARLRLRVRVHPVVLRRAHGARRELADRLAARAQRGERRLRERVEEVVLGEHGWLVLGRRARGRGLAFEPADEGAGAGGNPGQGEEGEAATGQTRRCCSAC